METPGISNHVTVCPSRDELAAFSAGLLPSTLLESVADHLSSCPRCQSTLGDLEGRGDTILSDLRRPLLQDPFLDEPECGQLEAYAKAIGLNLSRATTPLPDQATKPAADLATDLPVPARVGQYELLQKLGKGGMGVVYKARQRNLNRLVALKRILSGAYASPQELARFHIEATDLARLRHPNIVQIYETGEDENCPYFSMEFVDGGNLARQLDGAPLPARRAAELVEVLSRAMHHAHQQGIVHRDLKPGNVLVTADGVPKVTDFGLAKGLGREGEQTEPGAILGTPSYMAPEQACGKNDEIGPVTDVYGLGGILYELLTGRPPFRGTNAADTLHQVRSQEPVAPSRLQPKVPRDLETICLKCLQKEPHKRYASALALAEELRCFLHGEPIRARPVGPGERLWRWCRRNPALAAASGLAAAFLIMAATVSTIFAVYRAEAARRLTVALGQSEENRRKLSETTKKAAHLAFRQGLNLCEQGDAAAGMLWLGQSLEIATRAADKDLERVIRLNLDGWRRQVNPLRAILPHQSAVSAVAFSPDGKIIVTGSKDGMVQPWDAATAKPVGQPLKHQDPVHAIGFSPDGTTIITGSGDSPNLRDMRGEARLWDAATGQPFGPRLRHNGPVLAAAFSPDGQLILTASTDNTAKLWEAATGKLRATLDHTDVVRAIAFNPDGRTVLTASWRAAQLWDVATGRRVGQPFRHHEGRVLAVAFSPNGKIIATASEDRTARLWDAVKGEQIGPPLQHQDIVSAVAFSPDSLTVLTGSSDKTVRFWDASTCRPVSGPLRHQGKVLAAVFSPDSKAILTGSEDTTAKVWDAAAWTSPKPSLKHDDSVWAVAFSPDGQSVLTGSWDKTARLWNAVTGEPIGKALVHQDLVWAVALSPDGSIVLTGSLDKMACVWKASTGDKLLQLNGHDGIVHAVAFSPDGQRMLTGSADKTARLWETATGQPIGQLLHPDEVTMVAFSPDGQSVLTGCGDNIARLWDAATGKLTSELRQHRRLVRAVAFGPEGRKVLTASFDGTSQVWEATTGMPVGPSLVHQDKIWTAAFSPDGMTVGTASADGTARLWDAGTGLQTCQPLEHQGEVWTLAFSPDSKTMGTGSKDGTARLWDVATGSPVGPCLHHRGPVWALCFSPDGKTVLTGSRDNTAGLWQAPAALHGDPGQIILWTKVITATELDQGGTLRVLDAETWRRYRLRLNNHA
jgi:WD40 repeat protein/tRNA A-37 threonylcarbamoyl transferase component Bud32